METILLLASYLQYAPQAIHVAESIGAIINKVAKGEAYTPEESKIIDDAYKFAKAERKKIFPAEGENPE